MSLKETIRKIGRCSRNDLYLLVEAAVLLGIMRTAILLPFKHVVKLFGLKEGDAGGETEPIREDCAQMIGWAVRAAASRTPWQSRCLVQALRLRSDASKKKGPFDGVSGVGP